MEVKEKIADDMHAVKKRMPFILDTQNENERRSRMLVIASGRPSGPNDNLSILLKPPRDAVFDTCPPSDYDLISFHNRSYETQESRWPIQN